MHGNRLAQSRSRARHDRDHVQRVLRGQVHRRAGRGRKRRRIDTQVPEAGQARRRDRVRRCEQEDRHPSRRSAHGRALVAHGLERACRQAQSHQRAHTAHSIGHFARVRHCRGRCHRLWIQQY